MSHVPQRFEVRLAAMIKGAHDIIKLHAQQLNTMGSAVSALQPGDWETLALQNGWSPLAGYIPPQVRIQQNGMSLLVGHIAGGTVASGTVVGTLTPGYFNPVHAHTFTVNAISGASAVSHSGTLNDIAGDLNNGTVGESETFGAAPATYDQGYLQGVVNHFSNGSLYVRTGTTLHESGTSTPVNMNSPVMTLSISGVLTISNVDPNVNAISFSELIPLVTA